MDKIFSHPWHPWGPSSLPHEESGWIHLKPYGYAPGNYMGLCHGCCTEMHWVDKRAVTCRVCAEQYHKAAIKSVPVETEILTHPSYDDIQDMCRQIAVQMDLDEIAPTSVIGLTRGGLIPGVIMSHLLKLPLEVVSYSSKIGAGDDKCYDTKLPVLQNEIVIIIDDIADTGHTLKELYREYMSRGHVVFTAALYYKESSVFEPDWYVHKIPFDSHWIIFPWEQD